MTAIITTAPTACAGRLLSLPRPAPSPSFAINCKNGHDLLIAQFAQKWTRPGSPFSHETETSHDPSQKT
jgi:hypothetical protein